MIEDLNTQGSILDCLKELEGEARMTIKIDESLANSLELIDMRKTAIENLLMSYINNTTETANAMNLQNLVDVYTTASMERERLIKKMFFETLGDEANSYLLMPSSRLNYAVNFLSNTIMISRESNTCSL